MCLIYLQYHTFANGKTLLLQLQRITCIAVFFLFHFVCGCSKQVAIKKWL